MNDEAYRDYESLTVSAEGHSKSLEIALFYRLHMSYYWRSIGTMALSCISSEIKRDFVENRDFFILPLHSAPPCRNTGMSFGVDTRMMELLDGEERLKICLGISTLYWRVTDRRTDKRLLTS